MIGRKLSREELFAMVWERPTQEVSKELGVSDVAIGKLCTRLSGAKTATRLLGQVQSGKTPRRPPLGAFREEIERRRQEVARACAAEALTKLQQQFYDASLSDLKGRGVEVAGAA